MLWKAVRANTFHHIDFDRQRIIGNYIVDFYVKRLGLVVEIDGSSHEQKEEYDAERIAYLESLGLKVFVVYDFDVKFNLQLVLQDLENFIIQQYGTTPSSEIP